MVYKALKREALHDFTTPKDPASFTSASSYRLMRNVFTASKSHLWNMWKIFCSLLTPILSPSREGSPDVKFRRWYQQAMANGSDQRTTTQGYAYIMVGINIFTRFAFAQPPKNKMGETVIKAFKTMTLKKEWTPPFKERCGSIPVLYFGQLCRKQQGTD